MYRVMVGGYAVGEYADMRRRRCAGRKSVSTITCQLANLPHVFLPPFPSHPPWFVYVVYVTPHRYEGLTGDKHEMLTTYLSLHQTVRQLLETGAGGGGAGGGTPALPHLFHSLKLVRFHIITFSEE